jgi:hypothetical protein
MCVYLKRETHKHKEDEPGQFIMWLHTASSNFADHEAINFTTNFKLGAEPGSQVSRFKNENPVLHTKCSFFLLQPDAGLFGKCIILPHVRRKGAGSLDTDDQ